MIRAHQPGSEPIDIPETIPNPVVVPKPTPAPTEPAPKGQFGLQRRSPEVRKRTRIGCKLGSRVKVECSAWGDLGVFEHKNGMPTIAETLILIERDAIPHSRQDPA